MLYAWSVDEKDYVELYCSVEPSGVQISGLMMYEIWNHWYSDLKKKLTQTLGYEIGEPEDGYDFVFLNRLEFVIMLNCNFYNNEKVNDYNVDL